MTQFSNTFEGGTSGATITTANSGGGSGDAFNYVNLTGASTLTYDTTHVFGGVGAARFGVVASQFAALQYGSTGGANLNSDNLACEGKFYFTANPASDLWLIYAVNVSGTREFRVVLGTDGRLKIRDTGGSDLWVASTATPLNQFVFMRLYISNHGSGASFLKFALLDTDLTTVLGSFSTSTASRANSIAAVSFGKSDNGNAASAFWADDIKVETAATGFIGEAPLTAVVTATQRAVIDASASTGTITGRSISQISGEAGSAVVVSTGVWSVPIPSTGSAVWRVTLTGEGGQTVSDDKTITASVSQTVTYAPRIASGASPGGGWH